MAFGIVFDMHEGADMANDTKTFRSFIQMWTNEVYCVRRIQYTITTAYAWYQTWNQFRYSNLNSINNARA